MTESLKTASLQLIFTAQTARTLDKAALDSFLEVAAPLVAYCQSPPDAPKAVLRELFAVVEHLRAEAQWLRSDSAAALEAARRVELLFRQALLDGPRPPRVPGKPRII